MSTPEHTIRIISHRCDRGARKELISRICGYNSNVDSESAAVSQTVLCYDICTLRVIDSDYDKIDGKINETDIVFMDFRTYDHRDGTGQYEARKAWINQLAIAYDTVWIRRDYNNDTILKKIKRAQDASSPTDKWFAYIANRLKIRGIQTVISMFRPMEPMRPKAEAPWPIPEMTLSLPSFVKVEEVRHDPATNQIVIRFG